MVHRRFGLLAGAAFLAAPSLANFVVALGVIMGWLRQPPALAWAHEKDVHMTTLAGSAVLSLLGAGTLRLVTSGMLNLSAFSLPLDPASKEQLRLLGVISLLLEDCPQIALQVVHSVKQGADSATVHRT